MRYTRTSIHDHLGKLTIKSFGNTNLIFSCPAETFTSESLPIDSRHDNSICDDCFRLLEKYDELQQQSKAIRNKMATLYHAMRSQENIKQEPEVDCDDSPQLIQDSSDSDSDHNFSITEQFECDQCPATFSNSGLLREHITTTHIEKTELLNCETCSKDYKTDADLKIHLATDHDRGTGPFDCPICFKTYKDRANLRYHYVNIHSRERSILCVV